MYNDGGLCYRVFKLVLAATAAAAAVDWCTGSDGVRCLSALSAEFDVYYAVKKKSRSHRCNIFFLIFSAIVLLGPFF